MTIKNKTSNTFKPYFSDCMYQISFSLDCILKITIWVATLSFVTSHYTIFVIEKGTNFQQLTLSILLPFCTNYLHKVVLLVCMVIKILINSLKSWRDLCVVIYCFNNSTQEAEADRDRQSSLSFRPARST